MSEHDIKDNVKTVKSIVPAIRTTTATGSTIDTLGYRALLVQFETGALTDGTHTPKLTESDDDSSYSDVAAADMQGTLAALAASAVVQVGYIGKKRYVRPVITVTGSPATGLAASVDGLLADPVNLPAV